MLSNLASYLGYSSAPVDRAPPATVTADVRLRDEEDDWVLIEANEREGAAQSSEIIDDDQPGITRVTLAISTCPATLPGSSKNLSRSVSLDISCPLQESWYLTPPPSFTSEGPVHMETSPLENMLIEHPSMSVYEHTSRRNSSTPSASPCEEEPSLRPPSPSRVPRKEKLNKVSRNKINTKFSKKLTAKRANDDGTCDTEVLEAMEPEVKNFKSPRRSVNPSKSQRVPNISRSKPFEEMISGNEKSENGANSAEVQVVPTRKLYSEVLSSKPTPPPVQEPPAPEPVPEAKEQEVPETVAAPAVGEATAVESESVMSVEETPEEGAAEERTDMDSDRRRTVQTIVDHQQRQNFLTRSAQKVEQRKTCDLMKRNPLIRTNKAREINFRNKRQRRADMMQRHSGANNNRKC